MAKQNQKQTVSIAIMATDIGYIKKSIEGIENTIRNMSDHYVKKEELQAVQKEKEDVHKDHESRIRFIERYMWLAIGALGIVQFIASYLMNYFRENG